MPGVHRPPREIFAAGEAYRRFCFSVRRPVSDFPPTTTWRDVTLSLDALYQMAWRWLGLSAAVTLVPHVLVWGLDLPGSGAEVVGVGAATVVFVAVYLASIPVHEGLHALAMWLAGGLGWSEIHFGARWREGIVYVHAARPMSLRAYRVVLLTPAVVQGVLPAAVGLALGAWWLTLYGFTLLASALGDVAIFGRLHGLRGDLLARDHPEAVGCQVEAVAS